MADKLMYKPNNGVQHWPFCKIQLVVEMFGHSTYWTNQSKFNKSLKDVRKRIGKHYYKTLGTGVINSLMSPPSLEQNEFSLPILFTYPSDEC